MKSAIYLIVVLGFVLDFDTVLELIIVNFISIDINLLIYIFMNYKMGNKKSTPTTTSSSTTTVSTNGFIGTLKR